MNKNHSVATLVITLLSLGLWSSVAHAESNLALNKPVTVSSTEAASLPAGQAVDGDPTTRWSSEFSDHNWITIDLKARYELKEVKLYWQNSYSKDYDVKVSDDGVVWQTVESVLDSDGGLDKLQPAGGTGRFVRIEGYRRATRWGHSLWELEVYGTEAVEKDTQAPTVPQNLSASVDGPTSVSLSWEASSDDTEVTSYQVFRDGEFLVELAAPSTELTDSGLQPGASHEYTVLAVDSSDNESSLSDGAEVTLAAEVVTSDSAGSVNLALHKPISASSIETASLPAEQAVDGDPTTRWSSEFSDHNWITVDLQARYELTEVKLYWQNSYSKDYDVKVSDDGVVWHTVESVLDSDGGLDQLQLAGGTGRFVRIEGYRRATRWGHSLWELEINGHPVVENISHNKPVLASSIENNSLAPEYAVDGDSTTRWSSQFTNNEWFEIDFGAKHQVTQVKLYWQNSYSKDYEIQTSYDGEAWATVHIEENSDGGLDDLMVQGHGRYLRVNGSRRATRWGHSLWEIEVYGYATPEPATNEEQDPGQDDSSSPDDANSPDDGENQNPEDTQAPTVPTGLVASELVGPSVSLAWEAATDNLDLLSYEIYRDDVHLAELMAPITTFQDDAVETGTSYRYAVRAVDAAGNTSPLSTEARITLESQGADTVADGSVRLEWLTPDQRENGDYLELDEIGGYELRYREEGQSEGEVVVLDDSSVTTYTLEGLSGNYHFSIAVYDTNGLYSEFVQLEPVQN